MCLGFIGFKDLMKQQLKNKRIRASLIWIYRAFKQLRRLCSAPVNRTVLGENQCLKFRDTIKKSYDFTKVNVLERPAVSLTAYEKFSQSSAALL